MRLPFLLAVGQGHSAPICAKSSQAAVRHTYSYNYIHIHISISIYIYEYILYLFGFLLLLVPSSGLFICLLCSMQAATANWSQRCLNYLHTLVPCTYRMPSKPSSEPLMVSTGARAYALATRRLRSKTITLAQISSSICVHLSSTSCMCSCVRETEGESVSEWQRENGKQLTKDLDEQLAARQTKETENCNCNCN